MKQTKKIDVPTKLIKRIKQHLQDSHYPQSITSNDGCVVICALVTLNNAIRENRFKLPDSGIAPE